MTATLLTLFGVLTMFEPLQRVATEPIPLPTGPRLTIYRGDDELTEQTSDNREGNATPAEDSGAATGQHSPAVAPLPGVSLSDLALLIDASVRSAMRNQPSEPQRTLSPLGERKPVTLRDCLVWTENRLDWSKKTRLDYHRIVDRWEEFHAPSGLPHGPDIRDIKDGDYALFARAHGLTRSCYVKYFNTLLRSQTRQSAKVRYGKPADDVVLTSIPYEGDMSVKRDRTTKTQSISKPLDERDMSKLMEHWSTNWPARTPRLSSQDIGQIALSMFWFYGLRKTDGWLLHRSTIDINQRLLCYSETKAGNVGAVPIPEILVAPLWLALQDATAEGRDSLLPLDRRQVDDCGSDSGVYLRIKEAYSSAGVTPVKKGRETKWFHGFRASCSSKWMSIANQFRERMTLHAATSIVDKHYTLVTDDMRDAVERYPAPDALKRLSERIRQEYPDCPAKKE